MVSVVLSHRYSLKDFDNYMRNGFDIELPEDTIRLVSELAEQVGAPSYVKTPNFPIRDRLPEAAEPGAARKIGGGGAPSGMRRGRGVQEIANDDWESIRAFQATELQKKQGLDAHIDNIRASLNKVTDKTYADMLKNILTEIDGIIAENVDSDEAMLRIGESVFNTASSNHFYSALYAKLFKELMESHAVFGKVFEKSFAEFMKLFDRIDCVDPKKDYERFCEINKVNDNRKAMSLFIVNLMKQGIITPGNILDIVCQLQDLMAENLHKNNKTNEVDEITENLFIIIKNAHAELAATDDPLWKSKVLFNIQMISGLKAKAKPSITNKAIFKHMDMLDEMGIKK